jgi:SAM-dependent methyltransferase
MKGDSPKHAMSAAVDTLDERQRFGARTPAILNPGASTAVETNVAYRLGKLRDRGLLKGVWLDCGCADGGYTVALDKWGVQQAVGVEYNLDRVREAHARTATSATFACGSSEALPFAGDTFDGILLNEVLEHVPNEANTLREIHRVLRPCGHLVVMSPNRWFPFEGHGMQLGRREINVPIPFLPWLPGRLAGRFMRARNYWPHELGDAVREAGFEVREVSPVLPVFEVYPWLPDSAIRWYRRAVPTLETIPAIRWIAVSTLVVGRKPAA